MNWETYESNLHELEEATIDEGTQSRKEDIQRFHKRIPHT